MKKALSLKSIEEWNTVKKQADNTAEIIIFKYSPMCGISYSVETQFDKWLAKLKEDKNIIVVKVDVIFARELSQVIADETAIRHESPQLIWLDKDLKPKFSASHYDITKTALDKLVN